MHTQMDFIFWKGRTEIFFSSALNHDKFLNENEYKAFDIYRVLFLLKSFFFFVFIFKFTVFMF